MTREPSAHLAASVRGRLQNEARRSKRPFQEVFTHFALERFLYRLSRSRFADRFTLKGGLFLRAVEGPTGRPTRDADFLGHGDSSAETMEGLMRDVCVTEVEPDGMRFDPATVQARQTRPEEEYQGVEVKLTGFLEKSRAPLKVDVAFGDVVVPGVVDLVYPVILDFPPPRLRAYTKESVIAEKFQAMVFLGEVNGRLKDFYDIWFLAGRFGFDETELAEAIRATFERRTTELPPDPVALSERFASDPVRQREWEAFLRRSLIEDAPAVFADVIADITRFLHPIVAFHGKTTRESLTWTPNTGWSQR